MMICAFVNEAEDGSEHGREAGKRVKGVVYVRD